MKKIAILLALLIPILIANEAHAPKWVLGVVLTPFLLYAMYIDDDADEAPFGEWTKTLRTGSLLFIAAGELVMIFVLISLWSALSK